MNIIQDVINTEMSGKGHAYLYELRSFIDNYPLKGSNNENSTLVANSQASRARPSRTRQKPGRYRQN